MFAIRRSIEIDAGHRVPGHAGKCKNLHGHRYRFEALVAGSARPDGMVLDFGFLKDLMVECVDAPFDHGLVIWEGDPLLGALLGYPEGGRQMDGSLLWIATFGAEEAVAVEEVRAYAREHDVWMGRGSFGKVAVIKSPPTAEHLAEIAWRLMAPRIHERSDGLATLVSVTVRETPNCSATWPGGAA